MIDFNLRPQEYSPLVLAYIGDSIYEVHIRSRFVASCNEKVSSLHRKSSSFVCASAQSRAYNHIKELLTEEEDAVFKRGRNAKSATVPKNADVIEYRCATGLEALIGYLYIKKDYDRVEELMDIIFDHLAKPEGV